MSNIFCAAWRNPCLGLRSWGLLLQGPVPLRSASRITVPSQLYNIQSQRAPNSSTPLQFKSLYSQWFGVKLSSSTNPLRSPAIVTFRRCIQSKPTPSNDAVKLRPKPFTAAEIKSIFGARTKISADMGNRVLSALQGQRETGTIDLDLPADITRSVQQPTIDKGLQWLRKNYPFDEDAAILARFEREEQEERQSYIRRAEELGLYKPQSGSYGAERGEGDDPSGKSVLVEARKQNEERILAEQERKRQQWLEGEQRERERFLAQVQTQKGLQPYVDSGNLPVRARADPTERPYLAWVQRHYLENEKIVDPGAMSNTRRILPSLALALLTIGLCYAFAENYHPPAKTDRLWPNTPPAAATVLTIIGINLCIWFMWKVPPAWKMLNRYFISVAVRPYPLSTYGSMFSHHTVSHLAMNMAVLWYMGTQLHDEIGRGNFLALYLSSGAIGTVLSLASRVLTGKIMLTSLGASGAIAGVLSAFCLLHSEDRLHISWLPSEWHQYASAPGWVFLTGIVALEVISIATPFRIIELDHWAHLGGYLTGALWALYYKNRRQKEERQKSWFEKVFGS